MSCLTLGAIVIYAVISALQWCEMQKATRATQEAASAAKSAAVTAAATLESSNKSFQIEQRAWVGVQDAVSVPHSFTETTAWNVIMVFSNSGKTPARAAKIAVLALTPSAPVFGPSPDEIRALEFQPTQAIPPQGKYNFAISTGADWVPTMKAGKRDTESLIAKYPLIRNRQLILYYYGILRYDDASGKSHDTQFCIYMAKPQIQQISFCRDFNDLN